SADPRRSQTSTRSMILLMGMRGLPFGSKRRRYETKQMPGTGHCADLGLDQYRPAIRWAFEQQSFQIRRRFGRLVGNVEGGCEPIVPWITEINAKLLPELILLHLAHVAEVAVVEDYDRDIQIVLPGRRQFLESPAKPTI